MPPTTPDDTYKEEIRKVIRELKNDPDLTINFNTGTLSQHVATDKQARISMITAAIASARVFRLSLNQKGVEHIFNNVTRNSAYSAVLGVINTAISRGADPLNL